MEAFNSLISDRTAMVEQHQAFMEEITDIAALDRRIAKYTEECEVVAGLIRNAVDESARAAVDPAEYETRYNALVARYEATKEKVGRGAARGPAAGVAAGAGGGVLCRARK